MATALDVIKVWQKIQKYISRKQHNISPEGKLKGEELLREIERIEEVMKNIIHRYAQLVELVRTERTENNAPLSPQAEEELSRILQIVEEEESAATD